jgi:tryptophan synthase alpha chain
VKGDTGRLPAAFEAAKSENRAAFVAYLTAGDPDLARTVELARVLDRAGADVLELGVPFSDPIADGPTLQRAASRALAAGTTLSGVLECASEIRRRTNLALVLFTYANPLFARGIASAMREARRAGIDGVLLTDVPAEEAEEFVGPMAGAGLDPIFLVSPTSPEARMKAAARLSRGFLYVISRTGTTGEKRGLSPDLAATVRRARRAAPGLPVAVGFGISTAPDAARVARLADGVVVGSALVACAEKAGCEAAEAVASFAAGISKACRR